MKSLGGGNKAIDTIKSPHKRETFYEIRNIAHKKENKENIKERLFSQPPNQIRTGPGLDKMISYSTKKRKRSKLYLCRGLPEVLFKHCTKVTDTRITTKFANFRNSVFT